MNKQNWLSGPPAALVRRFIGVAFVGTLLSACAPSAIGSATMRPQQSDAPTADHHMATGMTIGALLFESHMQRLATPATATLIDSKFIIAWRDCWTEFTESAPDDARANLANYQFSFAALGNKQIVMFEPRNVAVEENYQPARSTAATWMYNIMPAEGETGFCIADPDAADPVRLMSLDDVYAEYPGLQSEAVLVPNSEVQE